MTEYPDTIRRMVVTMTTLVWFGIPQERISIDFGPAHGDPCLHGIIAIFGEDALVLGGIPCGRISDTYREEHRDHCAALWVAACESWNALPQEHRDHLWKSSFTSSTYLLDIGTALGLIGALDQETIDAKLAELG